MLAMPVRVEAEYGYISFDGNTRKTEPVCIVLEPCSRTYIRKDILPGEDYESGTMMFLTKNSEADAVMLRMDDMRNLKYAKTSVEIKEEMQQDGLEVLTITGNAFAHGVYVEGNYECSDDYFDILPGETKKITVKSYGVNNLSVKQVR